jgi:outer membrane lipoprotein-sorting protein
VRTIAGWRALLLAAVVVPALALPARAADFELPALMELLAAVPAAKDNFTETKHSAVLSTPLVLKGTLAYTRPDRLEKSVLAPYEERTIIAGNSVTMENRTLKQTRTFSLASSTPLSAFVESMRATLAGDRAALERHYRVQLEGMPEAWTMTLVPREKRLASLVKSIRIAGARERLKRIEVDEASGDRSVMLISPDQQ